MQASMDQLKFFAKPKLGLDCVGGASALRLSDALAQVSPQALCKNCISPESALHLDPTCCSHQQSPLLTKLNAYISSL